MVKYLLAAALLAAPSAWASGSASPKPPPPPQVDLLLPASADVQVKNPDGKDHPVRARLLLEKPTIAAGETARVGVHLIQHPEWHTYWKSPGDIGLPTDIAWTLPEGAQVTPHLYPVPQRFEQDGLISYGYEDQVLLISELSVPASAKPGTYDIAAEVSWLVCKTSCIPGSASLKLPVTIVAAGTTTQAGPAKPLFDHFAAQHPVDLAQVEGLSVESTLSASAVRPNEPFKIAFRIQPAEGVELPTVSGPWPTFTPIVGGADWMINALKVARTDAGEIVAVIEGETFEPEPLPTTDSIGGLIQLPIGGEWVRTEVVVPLPWAAAGATVEDHSDASVFKLAQTGDGGGPAGTDGGSSQGTAAGSPDESNAAGEVAANALAGGSLAGPAIAITPVSLILYMGLGLLGGLLLNVMPCVLPVLTLKLYGLVEQTDITPAQQRTAGLAYTGGILVSFWALALAIVLLRLVFGIEADWGFQFQYPPYVAALATIVFAFGLSLFGVFEIPAIGADRAGAATTREGAAGYFFTGVFATLLATPCSAPFLGSAVAYAFTAPSAVLLAIFTMIGLGLALPFLLVAFVPALYRLLPKPGAWMEAFKQLLGFTLIATTVWLVDVLLAQIGADRTIGFVGFLVFVALGCWVFGRFGGLGTSGSRQLAAAVGGLAVIGVGGLFFVDLEMAEAAECDSGEVITDLAFDEGIPWQPFTEDRVAKLADRPVFIDFTAEWCLTCKVNERTILETQAVRTAMAEHGVVPLKADWTRRDPTITEWLRRYGRAGVPFYLVLPPNGAEPITLPEVITPDMVIDAFQRSAARM